MEEQNESKIDEKKVQELAAWLKENCHRYQRFYTPSYISSDIDDTKTVAGIRLNISHGEDALEKVMAEDDKRNDDQEAIEEIMNA